MIMIMLNFQLQTLKLLLQFMKFVTLLH